MNDFWWLIIKKNHTKYCRCLLWDILSLSSMLTCQLYIYLNIWLKRNKLYMIKQTCRNIQTQELAVGIPGLFEVHCHSQTHWWRQLAVVHHRPENNDGALRPINISCTIPNGKVLANLEFNLKVLPWTLNHLSARVGFCSLKGNLR